MKNQKLCFVSSMKIEMIRTLNIHVLYKTRECSFSRSVSKDDGGKVARWLQL